MTKFLIRLLAVLEMLGGVSGVAIVFWQILAAPDDDPAITLAPIAAALYVFSFVAGLLLWRGRPVGRTASMAVQVLQLPKLMSPQIAFMFSVGCDLWVHYLWRDEFTALGFELKLPAFHQIFTNVESAPFVFGISFTALFFLVVLDRYKPDASSLQEPPSPPIHWDRSSDPSVGQPDHG